MSIWEKMAAVTLVFFPFPAVVYAHMAYCERVTSLLSGDFDFLECLYLDAKSPRIRVLTASQNWGMKKPRYKPGFC